MTKVLANTTDYPKRDLTNIPHRIAGSGWYKFDCRHRRAFLVSILADASGASGASHGHVIGSHQL
jgi:hypothetical protein